MRSQSFFSSFSRKGNKMLMRTLVASMLKPPSCISTSSPPPPPPPAAPRSAVAVSAGAGAAAGVGRSDADGSDGRVVVGRIVGKGEAPVAAVVPASLSFTGAGAAGGGGADDDAADDAANAPANVDGDGGIKDADIGINDEDIGAMDEVDDDASGTVGGAVDDEAPVNAVIVLTGCKLGGSAVVCIERN